MLLLFEKMKSTSFFLSNEPYDTFRGQKSLKLQSFKVNTAKDNGFSRIFNRIRSQHDDFFELCWHTFGSSGVALSFRIAWNSFWEICQSRNAKKILNFMLRKKISDLLNY